MRIVLTAGQAVLAHGWWKAREFLTWGDVLNNEKLTFAYLKENLGISEQNLYNLQPDLQSWIKTRKAVLKDCPMMTLWNAHPISDFAADLADLISMRWQAEQYKKMGVFYDNLLELGLTPETMILFGFTLMNWMQIGFTKTHCEVLPDHITYRLFSMTKIQVLSCFK
jgi:hypothetical protein